MRASRGQRGGRGQGVAWTDASPTISSARPGVTGMADPIYRLGYATGFRCARLLWGLTHPRHRGALVAVRVGRSILMLRQSYRSELGLPGGGIEEGEAPVAAACRELDEELDLTLPPDRLREVHVASGLWDGRHDTVTFFETELDALPPLRLDNREVVAAGLVAPDQLALRDVTPAVAAYLRWRRTGAGQATRTGCF